MRLRVRWKVRRDASTRGYTEAEVLEEIERRSPTSRITSSRRRRMPTWSSSTSTTTIARRRLTIRSRSRCA
ncbi:hypothetical protein AB1399_00075 [Hydrogenibacillus schlegelii]|uniref:hypothetical protein n=1 Tax=Hydrogenibacillus schlegelii TaxID=1484 RepID=UPI0034A08B70